MLPPRSGGRRPARWLALSAVLGGLFALLGAWLTQSAPRCPPQASCWGGGELVLLVGLALAGVCGATALLLVLGKVIRKLDSDREAVRLDRRK